MEKHIQDTINRWLTGNYDKETKAEIQSLIDAGNEKELIDAFYTDLDFGTGGLRGVMGAGTNRMNRYTVGKATQGLANYIKRAGFGHKPVAVAYDSRNNSELYAKETAEIFSSNGITCYLFSALRPTPELSYAVQKLGCTAGVVITASHNPKEYNGYKAYWDNGGQVIPPHDKGIIDEVKKVPDDGVKRGDKSRVKVIDREIDEPYLKEVTSLALNTEAVKKHHDIAIVYTPLHGTGSTMVPQALKRFGFTNVSIVSAQEKPDGNFSTVASPNPEEPGALAMAIEQAKQSGAELVIATDPDCDRMGCAVRQPDGSYELLSGNQIGSMIAHYILASKQAQNKLTPDNFIVKTIVTTELAKAIADSFKVGCVDVLTGFKWIADIIDRRKSGFLFGFEESYGYLAGNFVRDKDAVIASVLLAELLAVVTSKGETLTGYLNGMYARFGYFHAEGVSVTKKGVSGQEEIQQMMKHFREVPPKAVAGIAVTRYIDYKSRTVYNPDGTVGSVDLPPSDVLQYFLADGSKVTVRPSGTEPKIKFYFEVTVSGNDMQTARDAARAKVKELKQFAK
ncbi:MAG: phospho-sugar mutase [Spirochaetes bacterium]|nr:phospho-sugar mutase [Spirochaetota bacterium]